jgi:hypothetical protein
VALGDELLIEALDRGHSRVATRICTDLPGGQR